MEQRDYIIDQIDKAVQFIINLIANRKLEAKDQAMLDDDNVKALSAWVLRRKDPKIYGEIYECLMANINLDKLVPKVRALFTEK